ncbi:hypothetical protein ACF2JD_19980 [Aeromonas sp. A-5]|uniref:hypothetical protein n=1 Tax=Aeromonas ichthyocola TaxID=3367746 RepID=UPI0038DA1178
MQQRVAKHLLLLVCLLVLNCAAQPLAQTCPARPGPQLSGTARSSHPPTKRGQAASPQPSSCQLNGKWLSAANLLCAEQIFFAIAFVIALLAPLSRRSPALPPPINISPPERRLHLTLCVWRE